MQPSGQVDNRGRGVRIPDSVGTLESPQDFGRSCSGGDRGRARVAAPRVSSLPLGSPMPAGVRYPSRSNRS